MDAPASPLILTKLRVPAARPRMVPRRHLVERLTPETGTGLILVCAPAGYGKTTLLAEWSQTLVQDGVAVAWYGLDSGDDAPIPFGSYLIASLMQALGPTSGLARISRLLRSSPEIDLQRVMPDVINVVASSDRDCVLVLDDYHLIGSPSIHSAVTFLLEHLPRNMCVAIGSRADPPLPLARLRVRGQLQDIRAADLRFSRDETAQFLNAVMRLDLPPGLVAALEERTEGWVAGLQLAALSLSGRSGKDDFVASFTGGNRYLVEYLLEEVVNHQPAETQSFLLCTSILERLCAPLCDALLSQASGSGSILARLDLANLFLMPLDDEGYWYRYHHLFRDFLQARLQKTDPERVPSLHRAASEWYAAHGFLHEAVKHALQTRDWGFAAALVEQHGVSMALRGEFSTLYEWSAAFPEDVMRIHPSLCLFQANALVLAYGRQNRGRIEGRLRQVEQAADAQEDRQMTRLLRGQAATTRAVLEAVTPDPAIDPRQQFALAQTALVLLSEDDPACSAIALTIGYAHMALHDAVAGYKAMEEAKQLALVCRNYFGFVEATFHQARLAHAQGQLQRAADICLQGQADVSAILVHADQELPTAGCLDIALGCVLLEQDRLEDAEQALLRGLDLIGWGLNPYYLMTAYQALFRLREIQGRSVEALDYLTRLEDAWPDMAFCTRGLRVMHDLRTAPQAPLTLEEAASWCKDFSSSLDENVPPPGMGPLGAAEAYYLAYIAWVRAQIAIGNSTIALTYLERQLSLALSHGLTNRMIELSLLEVQAWQAEGDDKRAWSALDRALSAAEPQGYVCMFDQGPTLSQLLAEAAQHDIHRDYIERILAAIQIESHTSPSGTRDAATNPYGLGPAEQLTERELEIVRLMAGGATNQEIAERLVITVGTVKSHINHILRKLDAHNRTEAVARVRGLGLLEI